MRHFLFILEGSEVIPSVVRNEGTPPHETHGEEFLAETMQELHSITLMRSIPRSLEWVSSLELKIR